KPLPPTEGLSTSGVATFVTHMLQRSLGELFASSHASPAAPLTIPSPHSADVQSRLQAADSPPSSQSSGGWTSSSPQVGSVQRVVHSSVSSSSPSSHASPADALWTPSPQSEAVQSTLHEALSPASS